MRADPLPKRKNEENAVNSKAYMMEELSRLWPELEKSQIEEGLEVPKDKH